MTLKIHISDHNDNLHNTTAKRNLAGGVAGLNASDQVTKRLSYENITEGVVALDSNTLITIDYIPIYFDNLTETYFRVNPATGTCYYPERANDNNSATPADYISIGQYVEIAFTQDYVIREFRVFGNINHIGNGKFKIQHSAKNNIWVDNTINISVNTLASWGSWINLTTPVLTDKIRIIATTIDTGPNDIYLNEIEMRG